MFLVDGSGSVEAYGKGNFKRCLDFVKQVTSSFSVSRAEGHVSVTVYSTSPQTTFDLNTYYDINQVFKAVDVIKYPGKGTRTGQGLKSVYTKILTGARKGTPRVLIVMTDGKSQDKVDLYSRKLHRAGVAVYAIGIGRNFNEKDLKIMASSPKLKHVIKVDFPQMTTVISQIQAEVCKGKLFVPVCVEVFSFCVRVLVCNRGRVCVRVDAGVHIHTRAHAGVCTLFFVCLCLSMPGFVSVFVSMSESVWVSVCLCVCFYMNICVCLRLFQCLCVCV